MTSWFRSRLVRSLEGLRQSLEKSRLLIEEARQAMEQAIEDGRREAEAIYAEAPEFLETANLEHEERVNWKKEGF